MVLNWTELNEHPSTSWRRLTHIRSFQQIVATIVYEYILRELGDSHAFSQPLEFFQSTRMKIDSQSTINDVSHNTIRIHSFSHVAFNCCSTQIPNILEMNGDLFFFSFFHFFAVGNWKIGKIKLTAIKMLKEKKTKQTAINEIIMTIIFIYMMYYYINYSIV